MKPLRLDNVYAFQSPESAFSTIRAYPSPTVPQIPPSLTTGADGIHYPQVELQIPSPDLT